MQPPQLNHKYQALGNDSRYFVVTGGRGSGKSFAIGSFLALLTMEQGHKIQHQHLLFQSLLRR